MSVHRKKSERERLGLDGSVEDFSARRRAPRFAWSIDLRTFEVHFFDPDADGTYAPSPFMHGWPRSRMEAKRRALDELKAKRRDVNRSIRNLERAIAEAALSTTPTKPREAIPRNPSGEQETAIPAVNRGEG